MSKNDGKKEERPVNKGTEPKTKVYSIRFDTGEDKNAFHAYIKSLVNKAYPTPADVAINLMKHSKSCPFFSKK